MFLKNSLYNSEDYFFEKLSNINLKYIRNNSSTISVAKTVQQ